MAAPKEKTKEGGDKMKEEDAELDALLDSKITCSMTFNYEYFIMEKLYAIVFA